MDQLVVVKSNNVVCQFCKKKSNNCLAYGPKYELGNVRAHYFCVLLSDKLLQRGADNEGLLGFLKNDIDNELRRSMNLFCTYCGRENATISCATKKCKKHFHLPCGLQNGSLHQFIDKFKSYCKYHRPTQNIPIKILKEASKTKTICCICFDSLQVKDVDTLWAPCCEKTWYHKNCVQKLAHSAGYFFKCAICNDVLKFKDWMQRFGVFIPQQDASWELEPNAFEDLLFRYDSCDASPCKCPQGRKKNEENTMWEIILCESCGSQGIHIACGNLKFVEPEWECNGCKAITRNIKTDSIEMTKTVEEPSMVLKLSEVSQKKRRRSCEDLENYVLDKRKKVKLSSVQEVEEEEEEEIDVETVEIVNVVSNDDDDDGDDDVPVTIENKDEWNGKKANIEDDQEEDLEEFGSRQKVVTAVAIRQRSVLTFVKPGPLSYKLSVIQKVLANSSPPSQESETKNPEVIDLTDSDERQPGSDVEIIKEIAKRSPPHCNPVVCSRENPREDPTKPEHPPNVGVSATLTDTQEKSCLSTFEKTKGKELGCQVVGNDLIAFSG